MRKLILVLALAIVYSAAARGQEDPAGGLTVGPTREIPDGKLDYTPVADVSPQSGDYAPRIPLEVLPGPAGQAPAVELVYSAKRANGPLGAGWGLSFESAIERKSKTGGLAEMTADDTFWIDGEKLIAMQDGTYRTEQDDFTVYSKAELNGQLIGWTALKDGFARYYGMRNTFTSLLTDVNAVEYRDEIKSGGIIQGQEQVRWLLSATVSPFGAEVAYHYTVPDLPPLGRSSFRHLPDKIIYGVSGSTSNEIELGYSTRDDVRVSYASGPKRSEAKLLRRIMVKRIDGPAATSHYYLLQYQPAAHSPQLLLSEVKRLEVANPTAPPTAAGEASAPAESLARFAYQDDETEWGERKAIKLVGDPPLDVTPGQQFFSLPMTGDVNGDARPDLIVFNDECLSKRGPEGGDPPGPLGPLPPIHYYECEPDHRVYLNTIQESRVQASARTAGQIDPTSSSPVSLVRQHVLVYDRKLSRQVTTFYKALHDQFLNAQPMAIEDLNKDGFVELIKNGRLSAGGPDGWDTQGNSFGWAYLLEDHQFADVNGDGNPDLVGQSRYYLNTGTSPYFTTSLAIVDPVTAGHASDQYDQARASCLNSGDSGIYLRSDFGVNGLNQLSSNPAPDGAIRAEEWVWRYTTHPDVNGDGLADRVTSFPFLRHETQLESSDAWQMWVRDDDACGVFDQVFLGDGRGGFTAAGYGIGGPMQRERTFLQTRTLDDDGIDEPERDSYEFRYQLNHFALGDVDADGRNEITQFCANDRRFLALSDQGVGRWGPDESVGYGPGYGMSAASGSCPQQFTTPVPEEFFGLSLLDYHYSTILDFDGDGMADLFQYSLPYGNPDIVVSNDGTPWQDWQDGPHWRRNQRSTAQNRLVSISWPHGASTTVAWAWSADDPDNDFAINVEHVKSLEDGRGKHTFSFTGGAFEDGQFLGFRRVETLQPRGSTLVQTFFNSRVLRNKPSTEELYDEGGRLKNLRVHVPGSDRPDIWTEGLLLDVSAPYYNPLQRVCEFEFGAFNGSVQVGDDIDPYIARCEAFEDEEGLIAGPVLDQRSIFSVLRGGDPGLLAQTSTERSELAALQSLLQGEPIERICVSVPGDALRAAPPVICDRSPTAPRDHVGSQTPAPRTAAAVSWSAAPYRTSMKLAFPATELPDWGPVVVGTSAERMLVTEYDYDDDIGHVIEQRELRDVSTTSDSLIREYAYSTWNTAFGGVHLLHETTRDRLGKTYESIDYQNVVSGEWRTRVQHATLGSATRSDRRTFTALGEPQTATDVLGRTTTYEQGACGVTTSVIDPGGYTEATTLDRVCRPVRVRARFGEATIAQTEIAYDGYGRVVERSVDPAVGKGDDMPPMIERFAYDADARPVSPAAVTSLPQSDGSETLTKTYVDGWGRTLKTVRCERGSAAAGSGLDPLYPCRDDAEVVSETRYDETTGDVAEVIGPYRPDDRAQPSHRFTYDEFGRMVVDRRPDTTRLRYAYGLGERSVTDPLGRTTRVTFDTLSEDVEVAGHYRGGTRRDAFGRVTTTIDAAGSQTDIFYDGYNRRREQRQPLVEVLASGAATSAEQRPTTSFAYDDGDRLVSRTDANGHTYTFSYDALDRLLLTRGPDDVVVERRTHTEGGWGARSVRIRDARLGVEHVEHQDGLGRVWKQVAFDGTETLTDYDARGRAWRQTMPWGEVRTSELHDGGLTSVGTTTQGDVVATLTTTLDARGQPLKVTDADGQVLSNAYDLMGRLVAARQGSLETEDRDYDRAGRAIEVRASGVTTCYGYDELDNVVSEELGCDDSAKPRALVKTTRTYTPLGQVATETDGAGNVVASAYDALGRLLSVEISDRNATVKGKKQFRYDAMGNQTEALDELGLSLRTSYDTYDRPIVSDPPDQGPTRTAYVVASNSWVATTTSPTGEVVATTTDAMGRQVRACAADGICIQDVYADGLLTMRERTGAGTPAQVLGTRHYQYYPASARLRREWDWLTFAESRRCPGTVPDDCQVPHVEHTYTPAGRAATFRDRQGNLTTYGYQAANRSMLLTRVSRDGLPQQAYTYNKTYPILERRSIIGADGGGTITEDTEWTRNLRPASILRTDGKRREALTFRYDAAGRQTFAQLNQPKGTVGVRETFDTYGRPLTRRYEVAAGGASYAGTIGFSWRENGQLAGVTYPSGNAVTYDYDTATGRLQSIVAGGAPVFEAQKFDASGRARLLRLDDGAIELARTYDDAGREQERRIKGVASGPRRETYGYDGYGRLGTIVATEGSAVTNTVYGYDPRDRLISEMHTAKGGATRSFTYAYDPVTGLRTTKSDSDGTATTTTEYAYISGNRLASVGDTPITWDDYGRQAGDALGRTFKWGLVDQLVAIDDGANLETSWHDAAGLRVARADADGVAFFLAGPGGELLERRADGDTDATVDYVRLPSGVVVATIDQEGAVTPVLNGITGSPYRIGEATSAQHHYQDASGFGEVIEASGTLDEPLAFHEMLAGEADGILMAGVRAYDVTTGRFLSADPMGLVAASRAIDAADFFRYAQDNPIAMQDATGLAPCLMTLEGGCRSNLGEETYEEQRQAHRDHAASEAADQVRVAHDRFIAAWNREERLGRNPFDLLPRATDGAQLEADKSADGRSPSQMEDPTKPLLIVERFCYGEGCGGGASASSDGTTTESARSPNSSSSVHAVAEDEEGPSLREQPVSGGDRGRKKQRSARIPEDSANVGSATNPGDCALAAGECMPDDYLEVVVYGERLTLAERVLRFLEDNIFIPMYRGWYGDTEVVEESLSIFDDFRFGAGNPHRFIQNQNDPLVRDMRDSLGVEQIVGQFYGNVIRQGENAAVQTGVTGYGFRFSPGISPRTYLQAIGAHMDALIMDPEGGGQLFIGGWRGSLVASPSTESLIVSLNNSSSFNSYSLHLGQNIPAGMPYGTVKQTLEIQVPIDYGRLGRARELSSPTAITRRAPGIIGDETYRPKF